MFLRLSSGSGRKYSGFSICPIVLNCQFRSGCGVGSWILRHANSSNRVIIKPLCANYDFLRELCQHETRLQESGICTACPISVRHCPRSNTEHGSSSGREEHLDFIRLSFDTSVREYGRAQSQLSLCTLAHWHGSKSEHFDAETR